MNKKEYKVTLSVRLPYQEGAKISKRLRETRVGPLQQHVPITVGPYCLDQLILVREENRSIRTPDLVSQWREAQRANRLRQP